MGKNAGRSGRRWNAIKANVRARETHCFRCGMPIDWAIPYTDPDTGAVNLDSGSAEHIMARSKYPLLAEDPAVLAASHLLCNMQAGDRDNTLDIGASNREW